MNVMRFEATPIRGSYLVHLESRTDERGMFARAFCAEEFAAHGLQTTYVQGNIAVTRRSGTVRGMHFQRPPHEEVKLVRCVKGAIYDVIVDIRPDSTTRGQWFGARLSDKNGTMMYVPKGIAHGYQTFSDDASVFYLVSAAYAPGAEAGLRFDDPTIGIEWPLTVTETSDKDARWPLWQK